MLKEKNDLSKEDFLKTILESIIISENDRPEILVLSNMGSNNILER